MLPADPTLSIAERVDAACDRFETEWKRGVRPKIDDYLAAAPESDREELRQALLALELELRGRLEAEPSGSWSSAPSKGSAAQTATVDHGQGISSDVSKVVRFEIRGVLGSGAFGKVYRAFDPQLGREVAVKVPLATTVQSEKERAQFLKEARSAANINHPNVCQVHEVGEADGRPYIVMALVRGQSLADTLKARKTPLPEKQVALVVRKIALALATAHDNGIVHRDLKPANVMFDRERKDIVLMDFGLARAPQFSDARTTQSGVIMGTPAYMSPEQARGDAKGVGPAADIFSLGVILYELLTGTRPFTGTAMEVIGKILHVEPEKPSTVRPGIDPRLEDICLRAMAKDPAARFMSMKEFATALDAVLRKPASTGAAVETVKTHTTRREEDSESTNTSNNLAEVFAALSADRKQATAETAAAVEAAIAKHRTPRWVFALIGLLFFGGMSALAGIVFLTRSDKVRVDLAVIINDVDLKDTSLSFFLDDEPILAEKLAEPVELKPGVRIFTVKRGKDIIKRLELRVVGGWNPGIKVEDITPPPAPIDLPEKEIASTVPSADLERDFAKYLMAHGVRNVHVRKENGAESHIEHVVDLPDLPFVVVSYDPDGIQDIDDSTVEPILQWIKRNNINRVNLSFTAIGDDTVAKLAKLESLRAIYIGNTTITRASIPHLASRTDLTHLDICNSGNFTDGDLAQLKGLTRLVHLNVGKWSWSGAITDDGLRHLKGMKKLEFLDVQFHPVSAAGFEELRDLPLTRLNIGATKFRAEDLARVVVAYPEMFDFRLFGLDVTDEDLEPLTAWKKLSWIQLDNNPITDEGLRTLAKITTLNWIGIRNTKITPDGVAEFHRAIPGCSIAYPR